MRTPIGRRRIAGKRRGAVIVEFALVIPFVSLIAFGVIDFSRAYTQMNALQSALREGARAGGKMKDYTTAYYQDTIKARIKGYANQFGFVGLDTTKISVAWDVTPDPQLITVTVTNHPIPMQILGRFLGVPSLSVTRSVVYRWECAGIPTWSCK
jgi:Flp pilus assembly protein TadG